MGKKKVIWFFGVFIIALFMINFSYALEFDNIKNNKGNGPMNYPDIEIINAFGFGDTLFEGSITKHTSVCDTGCSSTIDLEHSGGVLIDEIYFNTLQKDGSWIEQDIIRYQFKYEVELPEYETECIDGPNFPNGTVEQICTTTQIGTYAGYKNYYVGEEMPEGKYELILDGAKKSYRTVDWVIRTHGETLTEWATWGNISLGADAEVILNSPEDDSIALTFLQTFNASANVTGGATLINMSLYTNITGTWGITNTTSSLDVSGEGLISYYRFDEQDTTGSGTIIDAVGIRNGVNSNAENTTGKIGTSYDFNGTDEIQLPSQYDSVDSYSTNAWIYLDTNDANLKAIYSQKNGASYINSFVNGDEQISCGNTNGFNYASSVFINQWLMVTCVSDGSRLKTYINGSEVNNIATSSVASLTGTMLIGEDADVGTRNWRGKIDEVSFYNKSLNTTEIANLYNSGSGSRPLTTSSTNIWENILNGSTLWNVEACDSDGDCGFATINYTVHLEAVGPKINISAPTGTIDYRVVGQNETLNVTFTDTNLDTCWYNYNGTNITIDGCLTGVKNSTQFLLETDNTDMIIYANDSVGNLNSTYNDWNYKILQLNLTYNEQVLDLSLEDFVMYVQASEEITSSKMNYNGTDYNSSILSLGSGLYKISNSIQVPDSDVDTNHTFFFNITTETTDIITNSYNQSVSILMIDNCAVYTNELFNITLFDEKTLLDLLGTIEVNLELFNADKTTALTTAVGEFYNISNTQICSNTNLTGTGYYYDLELRYYVDPTNTSNFLYVPEFYHIQKASVENFLQSLNLYNLNVNQSTEFIMFYRDNNYVARPNVLLQIQRKYVNEGIYRVVEIPITSSEGSGVGHFDLDNYKYKILATLNGEILNTFDNPAIICESELSGDCSLTLNGQGDPDPYKDYEEVNDVSYNIILNGTNITVEYVIPSGETKQVRVSMVQESSFADPITLCNNSITSSAGSFTCTANTTIGDSNVFIIVSANGNPSIATSAYYQEDLGDFFLLNNYAIAALFIILLVTMMVSSPKIMVVSAIFSVALLGYTFLLKGSSIGLVLGSFSWLVIAGIIILIKINRKDET